MEGHSSEILGKSPENLDTLVLVGKWPAPLSSSPHIPRFCLLPWLSLPPPKPGPQQRPLQPGLTPSIVCPQQAKSPSWSGRCWASCG